MWTSHNAIHRHIKIINSIHRDCVGWIYNDVHAAAIGDTKLTGF